MYISFLVAISLTWFKPINITTTTTTTTTIKINKKFFLLGLTYTRRNPF